MRIVDILKEKDSGVSFEVFPPKTDKGTTRLLDTVRKLLDFSPLYISVTYGAGGTSRDRTLKIVTELKKNDQLVVMPHLTCIGSSYKDIELIMDEYVRLGINNIMALRGDPPLEHRDKKLPVVDFIFARDLVRFIKRRYPDFCISVAVYPEGHIESPSWEKYIEYTKEKIDAGADFAITQMFFNNEYFYRMLDCFEKEKINIPVIPGIFPITDLSKLQRFSSFCGTTIPSFIFEELTPFINNSQEMSRRGINITIEQCRDLIKHGIRKLHFFTLNEYSAVGKIIENI